LTRRLPRWPLAALLLAAALPAAQAQTPMVPDLPPPPPVSPPMMPPTAAPTTPAPKGIAAIVNGTKITTTQVASEALKVVGPQLIGQMILIELVNQEAVKKHVVVTPAQVNARLIELRAQISQRVPGGLETVLAQRHQTLAAYKSQLVTELKVEALVAQTLPPAAATPKFHARHLLILTTSAGGFNVPGAKPPHTDAEALALIAQAQAELKAGKDFEAVANKYTEDPSGKGKGGDLGLIDSATPFDLNFLKAALALKPGGVTAVPVKSTYGYHLIKIDSSSAAPLASDRKLYADAQAAARRQQVQQAIGPYVQKLQSQAVIVNYLAGPAPPPMPQPPPGFVRPTMSPLPQPPPGSRTPAPRP